MENNKELKAALLRRIMEEAKPLTYAKLRLLLAFLRGLK